jgi:3-dehydroquinate dehydratase-1
MPDRCTLQCINRYLTARPAAFRGCLTLHTFFLASRLYHHCMKIVAALTDPSHAARAEAQGADLVELRLDLMSGDAVQIIRQYRKDCTLPVIATLRSAPEGGHWFGSADKWMEKIRPVIPHADYIDVEQQFSRHAPAIRAAGRTIIASYHAGAMMPLAFLFDKERELRAYGDIPKIVMTPKTTEDLVELVTFTEAAKKPVITGVMGSQFRYARAVLPLFGSAFVYCHSGDPTAEGQYSVEEFVALRNLLKMPG